MGWTVHGLTKKELCHSNETWHALNSTFSDTNCIVSFHLTNLTNLTKGFLFHQDNASAHKSVIAMAAVHDCGFELVDHSPNSPDLAPSIFCSPTWKEKHFAGKQYWTNDEVISAVEDFFEGESFYIPGIQALQHLWKKCVDRMGDYVEK